MHSVKSTLQGAVACLSPIANNSMNNGMLISYTHVNATSFFARKKKVKFCCLKIRDTNPVAHDNVNEACEKRCCYCL